MEVILGLSDLVVMQSKHTMSYIFDLKNLAIGLPVGKTLSNMIVINRRKMMKKKINQLILSLQIKKLILK